MLLITYIEEKENWLVGGGVILLDLGHLKTKMRRLDTIILFVQLLYKHTCLVRR